MKPSSVHPRQSISPARSAVGFTGPYAQRYWTAVIRRNDAVLQFKDGQWIQDGWLQDLDWPPLLRRIGVPHEIELRGGSRRFAGRPWRDWLHLYRAGSNREEAQRWNDDLARFRRVATLSSAGPDGLALTLDWTEEFGDDVGVQRAFVEFLLAGAGDRNATARDIKERRRRWDSEREKRNVRASRTR